ncbi:MAG: aminoacyl-tRNA hydrolase [Proteobacteria bacterium]|nr:aminoacyl-tRNA hydrolase [Pseudomonadota bacterium]
MQPIRVNRRVLIPGEAIRRAAVRSSGPGGQHVNKVASKVELRVDLRAIQGLSDAQRARLLAAARNRVDRQGRLIAVSQRTRSQSANLEDACSKIRHFVAQALPAPRKRIATKPSRAAKARRLDDKKRASDRKRERRWKPE